MNILLHKCARSTPAIRVEIAASSETAGVLAHRDGAVAIVSGVGAGHAFIVGVALIHDEGVYVQRQVPAVQGPKIYGRTVDAQAQDGPVDLIGQFAQFAAKGVKALAQCGARRHRAQAQSLVRKKRWVRKPSTASKSFLPRVSRPRWHLRMSLLAMPLRTGYLGSTRAGRLMRLNKRPTKASPPWLLRSWGNCLTTNSTGSVIMASRTRWVTGNCVVSACILTQYTLVLGAGSRIQVVSVCTLTKYALILGSSSRIQGDVR